MSKPHYEFHNKDDLYLIQELMDEIENLRAENDSLKDVNDELLDELQWSRN